MKKLFQKYEKGIYQAVGFCVFLIIAVSAFCSLTYIFRVNHSDRLFVVGLKEEEKDSLDMIYIGGSAAFVYWEPLKAYKDCGFTSYNLSTNSIQAENILAYIKYAQKYQNPSLYVIGVRAFQYYAEEGYEAGLRNTTDALDIGINRFQLIKKYLSNHIMDTDETALYWDIAKYHTNLDILASPMAWRLADNSVECQDKGAQIFDTWCYLEEPQGFQNEVRAELAGEAEEVLYELLDYCQDNQLNVLFVVCPYYISQGDYSKYNTVNDIVSSYGYQFLNANDYYTEIGIDFSKDLYNVNHVNSLGAEKYTAFLEKYLVQNYDLPDHRGDERFAEWGELASGFIQKSENSKNAVLSRIANADEGASLKETIVNTDNFADWANLVNDPRYTAVCVGDGTELVTASYGNKKIFEKMGWAGVCDAENFINISSGATLIGSNGDGGGNCTVNIGQQDAYTVPCVVENTNRELSICINGTECSLKNQEGINVVIFDNNYRNIIDSVSLSCDDKGDIFISR